MGISLGSTRLMSPIPVACVSGHLKKSFQLVLNYASSSGYRGICYPDDFFPSLAVRTGETEC